MKAQEFRNLIREEIQKVLKEASLNELKEMDFNKLQKIFAYITTPQEDLWDPIKVEKGQWDMSEQKTISGYDKNEFKSDLIYLKKLADAYTKGGEIFDKSISRYNDQVHSSVLESDHLADYLKDKNLGKQIQNLDNIYSQLANFLDSGSTKNVIQSYNKLVDWVKNFKL